MEETGQCNAEHFEMRIVFKYSLQLVLFFPDNKIRYYSATCLVNWPVTVHVYISIIFYLEYFFVGETALLYNKIHAFTFFTI